MNPMIIPKPLQIKVNHKEHFTLQDNFSVYLDPQIDLHHIPLFITDHLLPPTGFQFHIKQSSDESQLCFLYSSEVVNEGYDLELTQGQLVVKSSTPSGHLYGLITFMQLFDSAIFSDKKCDMKWEAICVSIKDSPQFSWRGMHLDCSRHFFNVAEVKKYLYWMSLHKLNTFHWHLTDDQGWRFESKKYPKLTEVGSILIQDDGTQYGPYFYTQDEMKDIVSYAKNLCITIVPEIDMPGHSESAYNSYPELFCQITVPKKSYWNRYKYIKAYCISNQSTIDFLKDILKELIEIFDSEYIHIGGDEVIPLYWENCEKCQKFMKEKGFEDSYDYQNWFTLLIADFLHENGRKMIGWDEILNDNLPKENAIMVWRSADIGSDAADLGHPIVLTPNEYLYFDHRQFKYHDGKEPYKYFGGPCSTVENVYEYNPVEGIKNKELILGVQACAWAEEMNDFKNVQWKVFPRICALSEMAWTKQELKNLDDFMQRLKVFHFKRLKQLNINYAT